MGGSKSKPSTASTDGGDGKPGASASKSAPSVKRGYLIFTTDSGGVLTLHWSDSAVPGALLSFTPKKSVPEFKMTQNAGRLELMRTNQNKTKFLEGVTHFIKEAGMFDSDVVLLTNDHFDLYYCNGNKVKQMKKGESVSTASIGALAAVPKHDDVFKGVQNIDVGKFVNTAQREGAAWKR